MVKIYSYEAGKTLGSHERFLKKLTSKGAKQVREHDDSTEIIVFCPIVSRFEIDVNAATDAALSEIKGKHGENRIKRYNVTFSFVFLLQFTVPLVCLCKGLTKERIILVAMHHTFDPDYALPDNRKMNSSFKLLVNCLFYKDKGLFRCPRNKAAYKEVRKQVIT